MSTAEAASPMTRESKGKSKGKGTSKSKSKSKSKKSKKVRFSSPSSDSPCNIVEPVVVVRGDAMKRTLSSTSQGSVLGDESSSSSDYRLGSLLSEEADLHLELPAPLDQELIGRAVDQLSAESTPSSVLSSSSSESDDKHNVNISDGDDDEDYMSSSSSLDSTVSSVSSSTLTEDMSSFSSDFYYSSESSSDSDSDSDSEIPKKERRRRRDERETGDAHLVDMSLEELDGHFRALLKAGHNGTFLSASAAAATSTRSSPQVSVDCFVGHPVSVNLSVAHLWLRGISAREASALRLGIGVLSEDRDRNFDRRRNERGLLRQQMTRSNSGLMQATPTSVKRSSGRTFSVAPLMRQLLAERNDEVDWVAFFTGSSYLTETERAWRNRPCADSTATKGPGDRLDWLWDAMYRDTLDGYRTLSRLEPFLLRPMWGISSSVADSYVHGAIFRPLVRLYYEPLPVVLRELAGRARPVGFFKSKKTIGHDAIARLKLPPSVASRQEKILKELYAMYKKMAHGFKKEHKKRNKGLSSESTESTATSEESSDGSDESEESDDTDFFSVTLTIQQQYLLTPTVANRWACYLFFVHHRIQLHGRKRPRSSITFRPGIKVTLRPRLGDLEFLASVMITQWCRQTGSLSLDKVFAKQLYMVNFVVKKRGRKLQDGWRANVFQAFKDLWKEQIEGNTTIRDGARRQDRLWQEESSGGDADHTVISRFKSRILPYLIDRLLRIGASLRKETSFSEILSECDAMWQWLSSALSTSSLLDNLGRTTVNSLAVAHMVLTAQIDTVFQALAVADPGTFFVDICAAYEDSHLQHPAALRASWSRLLMAIRQIVWLMLRRALQYEEMQEKLAPAKRFGDPRKLSGESKSGIDQFMKSRLTENVDLHEYQFALDVNRRSRRVKKESRRS